MTAHFPLAVAVLCCDCKHVSNGSLFCPACASAALLPLAPVLDRSTVTRTPANAPACVPVSEGGAQF